MYGAVIIDASSVHCVTVFDVSGTAQFPCGGGTINYNK